MTTQVYQVLHQGDARGDLGRDHHARVDASATATAARVEYDLRPGGAYRRPSPARRCEPMGTPERRRRRRGDRGRPAAPARADLAHPAGTSRSPPRASRRSPTRSSRGTGGATGSRSSTSSRAPRAPRRCSPATIGGRRRRLALGAQRPQDAAGDGRAAARLTGRAPALPRRRPSSRGVADGLAATVTNAREARLAGLSWCPLSSSGGGTRTHNPSINSRMLCLIELPRTVHVLRRIDGTIGRS